MVHIQFVVCKSLSGFYIFLNKNNYDQSGRNNIVWYNTFSIYCVSLCEFIRHAYRWTCYVASMCKYVCRNWSFKYKIQYNLFCLGSLRDILCRFANVTHKLTTTCQSQNALCGSQCHLVDVYTVSQSLRIDHDLSQAQLKHNPIMVEHMPRNIGWLYRTYYKIFKCKQLFKRLLLLFSVGIWIALLISSTRSHQNEDMRIIYHMQENVSQREQN